MRTAIRASSADIVLLKYKINASSKAYGDYAVRAKLSKRYSVLVHAALAVAPLIIGTGAYARDSSRVFFDSNRTGNFEIFMTKSGGADAVQLTRDKAYDSFWPKPSPDRKTIVFVRAPAGVHDTNYSKVTTWIMNSGGGELKQILPLGAHGWSIQGHPEWKPDGTKIVTIGGASHNSQIFIVDPDGSHPVRVSSNGKGGTRGGMNLDPSWHPDGRSLLFTGCPSFFCLPSSYEVYRVNVDGGALGQTDRLAAPNQRTPLGHLPHAAGRQRPTARD
jgi:Tol biopolymer transport system component